MTNCWSGLVRFFTKQKSGRRTEQADEETDVDYCPYGVFNAGQLMVIRLKFINFYFQGFKVTIIAPLLLTTCGLLTLGV